MQMENFENIRLPWPDWKIVKYLGGGAYGKVYEIERNISGMQERAALKIVSRPKDESEIEEDDKNGYDHESIVAKYTEILQDYIQEYKLMKELQGQSNIVSCDDFALEKNPNGIGGKIYIRMELLTPLQKVTKERLLSEEEVIKLGKDICKALILCENRNIIHRDIKPDNVMISSFGDYKLGDFGVSKVMGHTTAGTMTGTEGYIAPEVLHMEKYGKEVDIYSLGIVMYWLLNNRRMPFIEATGKLTPSKVNEASLRRYQGEKIPAPYNGSAELKRIVLKACEYRPKDRYTSAQEMYDALEEIGSGTVYRYEPEPSSYPVNGHSAGPSLEDDWMEGGKTGGKTVEGIREEDTARREALIALQRILKERMIYMQKNGESVEETRGGLNGGQTAGNSWDGSETIGKLKGNTKKEEKQEEPVSETIGVKKTSSEDSWMESGETIGKTMDAFSCGQTQGNSWGETGGTIGVPKGNRKTDTVLSKTIGAKEAYRRQEKEDKEKAKIIAEINQRHEKSINSPKKNVGSFGRAIRGILNKSEDEIDENGKVFRRTYFHKNGKINSIYEFDENGNITKFVNYDKQGELKEYMIHSYDENQKKQRCITYEKNGAVSSEFRFEYDRNGNQIKSILYDGAGNLTGYWITEYDSNNNKIKQTYYDAAGNPKKS